MPWQIDRRDGVAVVTMNTNRVNAQNETFFTDLHEAFDQLERDHGDSAVVLTAQGGVFSAGLDFDEAFARLARRDQRDIDTWFGRFRATHLRLFTYPRPTVAAINGHAMAGGLITALDCDVRIVVARGPRLSLNETQIGLPMPAAYVEIIRYAIGSRAAAEMILGGRTYSPDEALALGLVHAVVPPEELSDTAIELARQVPADAREAYGASKRALQAPVLKAIAEIADPLDATHLARVMTSEGTLHCIARQYERVRGRKAAWDTL